MTTITAYQFDHLRDLVLKESAIVLEPGKEYTSRAAWPRSLGAKVSRRSPISCRS